MKSYHFSLGNSTDGPVGYCAQVNANSKAEALKLLKEALPSEKLVAGVEYRGGPLTEKGLDYIAAYFNVEALSEADIDDWGYVSERTD